MCDDSHNKVKSTDTKECHSYVHGGFIARQQHAGRARDGKAL